MKILKWGIAVVALLLVISFVWPLFQMTASERFDKTMKLGYFGALYAANFSMEEYARQHGGEIPDSMEILMVDSTKKTGFDEQFGNQYVQILQRTIIEPMFKTPTGTVNSWLMAVLIPKGSVDSDEYVYYYFGHSMEGISGGNDFMTSSEFAGVFGQPLLDEVKYQDSHPGSVRLVKRNARQGESPNDYNEPAWYFLADTPIAASYATTRPVWFNRNICPFQKPLHFRNGSWDLPEAYVSSTGSRLALRVKGDGGAGEDNLHFNFANHKNDTPVIAAFVYKDNTTKSLFLSFTDSSGRVAKWEYSLANTIEHARLRPINNGTLANPTIPPADGKPLDLSHILKWELSGDGNPNSFVSIEITNIKIDDK